jgi:methylphosphotriester-DNA--protein-cysteine methyltransferase
MMHEERWQAEPSRDRRFDGGFVYGVRSTGTTAVHPALPDDLNGNR